MFKIGFIFIKYIYIAYKFFKLTLDTYDHFVDFFHMCTSSMLYFSFF